MTQPISILGAGAIGCMLAGYFSQAQVPVQFILRDENEQATYLKQGGVKWIGEQPQHFNIATSLANESSVLGIVLITTKAYSAAQALHNIRHRLNSHSLIVLLTNGLGLAEEIALLFPSVPLCLGSNYSSAYKPAPFTIVPVSRGEFYFGQYLTSPIAQEQMEQLLLAFQTAAFATSLEDDIMARLWQKFATNCVINPLTAILRARNGELLNETWFDLERSLCEEIALVAQAEHQPLNASALFNFVQQIASQTQENYTSMLQDVTAGNQTEIAYLNGYLVQRARALQLPVPLNHLLTTLVTGVTTDEKNFFKPFTRDESQR
jgi:2-dehydropantoate 2-reductase